MCRREGFDSLREGERAGYEEMDRDVKNSYRAVSGRAISGEYNVKLVTGFVSV